MQQDLFSGILFFEEGTGERELNSSFFNTGQLISGKSVRFTLSPCVIASVVVLVNLCQVLLQLCNQPQASERE